MKIVYYLNNISIKKKLILFFILISLVPTLVIGVISYKISESIIKDREVVRTIRNLMDVDELVFNYLESKRYIAIRLSMDNNVTALLGNNNLEEAERVKCEFEIRKLLNDYRNTEGIQSIYLFDSSGKEYTNDINKTESYERIIFTKWYNEILAEKSFMWGDIRELNNIYTFPFYRISKDSESDSLTGLVLINIREDYVYKLYENLEDVHGDILIFNQNNRVISSRNKSFLGKEIEDVIGRKIHLEEQQGVLETKIGRRNYLITYYRNDILGWNYVCLEKLSSILSASLRIKLLTFFLCLFSLIVTILFSIFLSAKFTKPFKKLLNSIKEARQGNLDVEVNFKSKDEFGIVGNAFDDMLKRLKQSIIDIYDAEQKKKEAEIKALLMQINPHFLYNTLTSIIWMTNSGRKNDVINMVSSLSRLFRIGISRGKEIIMVDEEIQHAESYLVIQKIRYKDEFTYKFEVSESVRRLYMPKLLLQPLIENSIYHGIKNVEHSCFIKIKAFIEYDKLIFEVIDNGNMISEDEVSSLNAFLITNEQNSNYGIGVKNVNSRIKLYFGENYGLAYKKEDEVLFARITLPVLEEYIKV